MVDDLRHAILAGDEPPGTLIPVDAVARFVGVRPIPVLEALQVLCGEGVVEHRPRAGFTVAKLAFAEFAELYDVRAALEAAALRQSVLRATGDDDRRVRRCHDDVGRAVAEDDDREYHGASRRFHLALIAPAGMLRLGHMYESAWSMTEPVRPMSRTDTDERLALHADHDQMVSAFVARDAGVLASVIVPKLAGVPTWLPDSSWFVGRGVGFPAFLVLADRAGVAPQRAGVGRVAPRRGDGRPRGRGARARGRARWLRRVRDRLLRRPRAPRVP